MTDEQLILIDEPAEHVRRVTLNRPHKRNAISTPLRVAPAQRSARFRQGPRCAGHDRAGCGSVLLVGV